MQQASLSTVFARCKFKFTPRQAAFTPDERTLIAASADGTLTLWSTKSLRPLGALALPRRRAPSSPPPVAASSVPGSGSGGGRALGLFPSCFAVTPDSKSIIVGTTAPPLLLVYDIASLSLRHGAALPRAALGVAGLQLLPDSRTAAVLCGDGLVRLVDFESCELEGEVAMRSAAATAAGSNVGGAKRPAAVVRAEAIAADCRGNLLAAITDDGDARLYDLAAVRAALAAARRQSAAAAGGAAARGGCGEEGVRLVSAAELAALPGSLLDGSHPLPLRLGAAAAAAARAAGGEVWQLTAAPGQGRVDWALEKASSLLLVLAHGDAAVKAAMCSKDALQSLLDCLQRLTPPHLVRVRARGVLPAAAVSQGLHFLLPASLLPSKGLCLALQACMHA